MGLNTAGWAFDLPDEDEDEGEDDDEEEALSPPPPPKLPRWPLSR